MTYTAKLISYALPYVLTTAKIIRCIPYMKFSSSLFQLEAFVVYYLPFFFRFNFGHTIKKPAKSGPMKKAFICLLEEICDVSVQVFI